MQEIDNRQNTFIGAGDIDACFARRRAPSRRVATKNIAVTQLIPIVSLFHAQANLRIPFLIGPLAKRISRSNSLFLPFLRSYRYANMVLYLCVTVRIVVTEIKRFLYECCTRVVVKECNAHRIGFSHQVRSFSCLFFSRCRSHVFSSDNERSVGELTSVEAIAGKSPAIVSIKIVKWIQTRSIS